MSYTRDAKFAPTPQQFRAARAVKGWTVRKVCEQTAMGEGTLGKLEGDGDARLSSADKLRELYENEGFSFAPDGRGLSW